jgi:hypothetical protein
MRKEKKFNIEIDLLDKLYQLKENHNQNIDDFINEILRNSLMNNSPLNSIVLSDKTNYELKKTKELFNNLDIAGNKEDELIGYALRLIQNINNTKLPRKE